MPFSVELQVDEVGSTLEPEALQVTLRSTPRVSSLIRHGFFPLSPYTMRYASLSDFLNHVRQRNALEPEYFQAVHEVASSVWPYIAAHPRYFEQGLLDRLIEPERVIQFRVSWVDD